VNLGSVGPISLPLTLTHHEASTELSRVHDQVATVDARWNLELDSHGAATGHRPDVARSNGPGVDANTWYPTRRVLG
jgi:hypothetical protein